MSDFIAGLLVYLIDTLFTFALIACLASIFCWAFNLPCSLKICFGFWAGVKLINTALTGNLSFLSVSAEQENGE